MTKKKEVSVLNEPTLARLRDIASRVSKKKGVYEEWELNWAQKQAIHDEKSAKLLKKVGKFIEGKDQEDTTEI
jgi:hypothetical protein|tara:strand:- start:1965 stop:2183 length:219 start_codon:yes stop_codon:yes gene_type:complete